MPFALSPADFKRLEPYLPRGLVRGAADNLLDGAAGQLARMVLTQEINPGQKIPMDEIAEAIGASRTPVREALRLLETEGLVSQLPNRGFIVRRLDPEQTEELYGARRCLEAYLADEAMRRSDEAFLRSLRALHAMYERVLGGPADRRRLGMLVDKAFHLRIAEQAGNGYLRGLLANIFDRLILTRPIEGFPIHRTPIAVTEHGEILAAFESSAAKAVRQSMLRNIENGRAAIVQHLRGMREFLHEHTNEEEER
ncbi:MAG TPA: GntR family transcriptional regulator [Usitatibacter sp.]|nr:GntR family transcriptional regulator [Usitatibacter sp.]